ncbi:hypothetical protein KGD82_13735 [Nocardiopsis eucommiae]|uniref:Uncharacterized protein n=1 Tax=Nocardiopsis eucommiae TaxID=2831970 RepID=A0A975LDB6_9ACTN|nr:hypothetical protein KGD82_13735 [Nocardiopsis eucommiae]
MLAHNTVNYMKYVARDFLGHEPAGAPYTPHGDTHPTEWLMYAGPNGDLLARHMEDFGYTVTSHGGGTIGVSGTPTAVERVRDLEIRQAQARVEEIRTTDPERLMQMAERF